MMMMVVVIGKLIRRGRRQELTARAQGNPASQKVRQVAGFAGIVADFAGIVSSCLAVVVAAFQVFHSVFAAIVVVFAAFPLGISEKFEVVSGISGTPYLSHIFP